MTSSETTSPEIRVMPSSKEAGDGTHGPRQEPIRIGLEMARPQHCAGGICRRDCCTPSARQMNTELGRSIKHSGAII
jgi:hypothetical protein